MFDSKPMNYMGNAVPTAMIEIDKTSCMQRLQGNTCEFYMEGQNLLSIRESIAYYWATAAQ